MTRAWRACLTNDADPAVQKAGVSQRQVWTTATFGEAAEYVIVTPVQSLTEFDDRTPLATAPGPDGWTALMAKRQRLINGSNTFLITARPELGVAAAAGYQSTLGVSSRSIVTPGHVNDFATFPAAFAKAAAEARLQPRVDGTVMNNEWRVYRCVLELSTIS